MPKRSRKPKPTDPNQLAARIEEPTAHEKPDEGKKSEKNPAAVALGRLGGLKGGRARAAKLGKRRRAAIARRAANARWKKT